MTQNPAVAFRGELSFCSNFFICAFTYNGVMFPTSEHAFQWAKCKNEADKVKVLQAITPGDAKKIGKQVELVDDWDTKRLTVMLEVIRAKFKNPLLADRLIKTGDKELVEHNTWNDYYWGVCNGEGENWLGKILMKVREELKCSHSETK